ncbi:DUF3883 domain-containing protein [Methylococcus geothermalis]|uniref:DUF3883 domain-containing protein n=1 Tax=Methylococcus geothermalis TaxID=2681310 RepID=A0A858Q6E3_9GAMM|nr:DUF3883 domain-containing protein [Methylococcus geothermalis]QJD29442.1 DUF3883 domain-containing protein [Methylococcus geothermalis]
MPQNSSEIKPYDWVIENTKTKNWVEWIASHELKIDYSDIETWDHKNWGTWGKSGGPPVLLKSDLKSTFWYNDRKKIAEKMLLLRPKQATLKHRGGRHYLMVGSEELWSSKYEKVAECALAAFNAGDIRRLLALEPAYVATSCPPTSPKPIGKPTQHKLSDVDFKSLQDAKATVGRAGELIAFEYEKQRLLTDVGCTDPAQYVTLLAIEDVGAGYDIESLYPGQERYIEVKSSTQYPNEFYITKNELDTLTAKGEQAWIYIVKVDKDMQGGRGCLNVVEPVR